VAALGRARLTMVAVEDLHWASRPFLDLLEHLVLGLDDTAVLVVGTSRPELVEQRPAWGAAAANATALTLTALTPAESEELVARLLGHGALDEAQRRHVSARAEGNPFFVEEILQMLVDRGAIAHGPDGWQRVADIDVGELPDSVHGVIASRIDLLEADARDALRRCSVIGRVFWPAAIGVPDDLVASMAPRGLVGEQPASTMAGMREFRFKHALTRDVAYASLPRTERRRLHGRVADWIEEIAPGREGETAELAAHHLTEAIALGETDPAVRGRAIAQLLLAGDAALARGATDPARRHLDGALALATTDRERCEAELALGRLDLLEGRPAAAVARLEHALALSGALRDDRLRGRALGLSSRAYWLLGRQGEARSAADEAVEALRGLAGSSELAWALARRSQLEMLAGVPGAARSAEEAIAVARAAGDRAAEANARINRLTARANAGAAPDPEEVRAVVDLALSAGVSEEAYRAVVNFLWSAQGMVPIPELDRLVADLREPLQHVRPLELFGSYLDLSYATILHVPAGRWADADRIVAEHPSHQWTTARIVWCDVAGGLAFRRGDLEAAAPLLDELASLALPSLEAQRIVPAACVLSGFAVATGRSDLLHDTMHAVHAVRDTNWMPAFAAAPICLALSRAGEVDELRRLVALLEDEAGREGLLGHHRVSLAAGRGLVARGEGRLPEAAEALREAVATEHGLGRIVPAACLEAELAAVLDEAGEGEAADEARERSRAVLDPLGCVYAF
jgi:tetratricopeptide (TPR) repeat protein